MSLHVSHLNQWRALKVDHRLLDEYLSKPLADPGVRRVLDSLYRTLQSKDAYIRELEQERSRYKAALKMRITLAQKKKLKEKLRAARQL